MVSCFHYSKSESDLNIEISLINIRLAIRKTVRSINGYEFISLVTCNHGNTPLLERTVHAIPHAKCEQRKPLFVTIHMTIYI